MQEKELIHAFTDFLNKQKGFFQNCLAYKNSYTSKKGNRYYIDLIVFDDKIVNQPLAIVEFKTNIPAEGATTEKTREHLSYVGEIEVPAYLVCPSKDDFWIYELIDDKWVKLEKNNFPDFMSLKDNFSAKEKIKDFENAKNAKDKARRLQRKKAYTSLLSIIIAIVGGLVSTIAISGVFSTKDNSKSREKQITLRIENLEDKIIDNKNNTEIFTRQLKDIITANNNIKDSIQSRLYFHNQLLRLNQSVELIKSENSKFDKELEELERVISKDPLYLIELHTIRTDITLLEKDLDNDIIMLNRDLESINEKYNFLIGGIITLIISILVLAIPNLIQGIKNTKVNIL